MSSYSLRLRLLVGAAVAMFGALAIAWLAMTIIFDRHIERRLEQELRHHGTQLIAALEIDAAGRITLLRTPTDPRFEAPASGLYWQASTLTDIERSRSLWDQTLGRGSLGIQGEWQARRTAGPFGQDLLLIERVVRLGRDHRRAFVRVAQDESSALAARQEAGREIAMFLLVLWLVLAVAAWIQVALGLRPLSQLRADVMALKRSPAERLAAAYPREVGPLIEAINALATARENDLRRALQRAADLAHGMKTPLAALSAQTRLIREAGGETAGFDRAIAAATAAVEAELARTRAAASRHAAQSQLTAPHVVCRKLIAVIDRTENGMRLDYTLDLPQDILVGIPAEDLSELLGTLLENAVRFARRRVRISGHQDADRTCIRIEDDGTGMTDEQIVAAMKRGVRLDERGGGHGLGLAIAADLTEATGGVIRLGRSKLGGLGVELEWTSPQPNLEPSWSHHARNTTAHRLCRAFRSRTRRQATR